jgi:hypothetical protein
MLVGKDLEEGSRALFEGSILVLARIDKGKLHKNFVRLDESRSKFEPDTSRIQVTATPVCLVMSVDNMKSVFEKWFQRL